MTIIKVVYLWNLTKNCVIPGLRSLSLSLCLLVFLFLGLIHSSNHEVFTFVTHCFCSYTIEWWSASNSFHTYIFLRLWILHVRIESKCVKNQLCKSPPPCTKFNFSLLCIDYVFVIFSKYIDVSIWLLKPQRMWRGIRKLALIH